MGVFFGAFTPSDLACGPATCLKGGVGCALTVSLHLFDAKGDSAHDTIQVLKNFIVRKPKQCDAKSLQMLLTLKIPGGRVIMAPTIYLNPETVDGAQEIDDEGADGSLAKEAHAESAPPQTRP